MRRFDPNDDEAVCNADWSFDPYADDISAYNNERLVLRTLSTREWLQNHSLVELDYEAYSILLERLDRERNTRIEQGQLWLEEVDQGVPMLLYQLVAGDFGAMDIVAIENMELITGNPGDLGTEPIMTLSQLDAFRAENGLQETDLTTFLQDASAVRFRSDEEFARGDYLPLYSDGGDLVSAETPTEGMEYAYQSSLDWWLDDLTATGVTGATANSSTRNRLLAEAFVNHNPNSRAGSIAEAYALSGRQSLYGFGVLDRNHMSWEHPSRGTMSGNYPMGDQSNLFGPLPQEGSVKMRRSGTSAYNSPSQIRNFDTYLRGYAQMLDMDPDYRGFSHFAANDPAGRTAAEIRADSGLIIPADDVDAVRSLLSDPHAFDLTESGNQSSTPNYQRAEIRTIYDGLLQDAPIQPNDGGPALSTVHDIDAALEDGRIGIMEHDMYLRELGDSAASRIYSNADFNMSIHNRFQGAWDAMHPSFRPEAPTGERPILHSATRSDTSATYDSLSHVQRYGNYLDRLSSVVPENTGALHVDEGDAAPLRELLRNPLGHDATPSGGESRTPNFQRSQINRVYNAVLDRTPVTSADGVTFNNVDAIHSAYEAGNIDAREYSRLMHRVGRLAANQVQPRTNAVVDAHEDAMTEYRRRQAEYRQELDRARSSIRGNVTPEYMDWVGAGGGTRGDVRVATRYGGRGALLGLGMGLATEGYSMLTDDQANPDAVERLAAAGGREGLRGGLSSATESVAMSRVSNYLLREGVESGAGRAIAMRAGARFLPGVVDVGFEAFDMATDNRENSGTEIAVRSSRALVIGGASSVLGAVAGSAAAGAVAGSVVPGVGTAIGFVVGLAVGIGTALLLNEVIPGGREDWGPEAEARRRREREQQRSRSPSRRPVCFAMGTKIRLANGSEKNIEELGVGDQLFAYDVEQQQFKIERINQFFSYGDHPTIAIHIDALNKPLRLSAEHPLYDGRVWKAGKDFSEGDAIALITQAGDLQIATVTATKIAETLPVFNLTVTGCNTYIAGGVLAHNMNK